MILVWFAAALVWVMIPVANLAGLAATILAIVCLCRRERRRQGLLILGGGFLGGLTGLAFFSAGYYSTQPWTLRGEEVMRLGTLWAGAGYGLWASGVAAVLPLVGRWRRRRSGRMQGQRDGSIPR